MKIGPGFGGKRIMQVVEFLSKVPCANTRRISERLKIAYSHAHHLLNKLKGYNIVNDIYVKEYFPFHRSYMVVRYWYLKGKREEAMRWLKSDSHISLLKKPKFYKNLLKHIEHSITGNTTSD